MIEISVISREDWSDSNYRRGYHKARGVYIFTETLEDYHKPKLKVGMTENLQQRLDSHKGKGWETVYFINVFGKHGTPILHNLEYLMYDTLVHTRKFVTRDRQSPRRVEGIPEEFITVIKGYYEESLSYFSKLLGQQLLDVFDDWEACVKTSDRYIKQDDWYYPDTLYKEKTGLYTVDVGTILFDLEGQAYQSGVRYSAIDMGMLLTNKSNLHKIQQPSIYKQNK